MTATLPFGAWPSALAAADVAAGAAGVGELRSHDGALYWLEGRPAEAGRVTLMRWRQGMPADTADELTPAPFSVRSRVHEYGGGAYLPTPAGVFFVRNDDQDIHLIAPDGVIHRLTDDGDAVRHADFCWDAERHRLLVVSERHTPGAEPTNAIEALEVDLDAPAPRARRVPFHGGHDFYAAPRLSADGARVAFVAWDHPNMPWDGSQLWVVDLAPDGTPGAETLVAGGAAESVVQPQWMDDGGLLFAADGNGYWNLYRYDDSGLFCLLEDGAEYAEPPWVFGQSSFAPVGGGYVAAVRRDAQSSELVLVDTRSGFASPLPDAGGGWWEHEHLCVLDRQLAFVGGAPDAASAIVLVPLSGGEPRVIARADAPPVDPAAYARPEPLRYPTRDRRHAYAFYYPPHNPEVAAPASERPPLVVMTHGGPTSRARAVLNLRIQYFTSRGFAVLDVDYRGSSGYGRAYRDALRGQWGLLDVSDCEDGVHHLTGRDLVDPRRVAIRGGSAGGFTTLSALTRSVVFRAGASQYGIGDLTALARDTHKFESRYLDALLGSEEALVARSPIHHIDRLSCPVVFFQGSEDRVVPPNQAADMVAALDRKGLPVAYLEFPGEGHGFRQAAHIQRALEAEYTFYCRVFGIQPDAPLPELEIRNL